MANKFEFESHENIFAENDTLEPLLVLVKFLSEISGVQTPKTSPPVTALVDWSNCIIVIRLYYIIIITRFPARSSNSCVHKLKYFYARPM